MIEEMSKADAVDWFSRYHYTGTVGGTRFFRTDDAAVAVGKGGNRFGVGSKFGLEAWRGDIEITRVACHPDAPRNTASRIIGQVCRLLGSEGVEWLFSYSDTAQGHHGGIYQAVNAVYVGTDAKQWVNFALDGKRVSKRMVSGKFGHTRWPEVQDIARQQGYDLERVPWAPKLTYILPVATDRRAQRDIRAALAPISLPYPKRTDDLTKLSTRYRNSRPKQVDGCI